MLQERKRKETNEDDECEYLLVIRVNNSTMKSKIKCSYRINFTKPNIGYLLKFSNCILEPQQWHESKINRIKIHQYHSLEYNAGVYCNDKSVHMSFRCAYRQDIRYRKCLRRSHYLPIVIRDIMDLMIQECPV